MSIPVKQLAALLNLSTRRVQQLANDGIIYRDEHGKYDLVRSVRSYIRYLQDRSIGRDAGPIDSHKERARLLRAQADKTELEVRTLRGVLIPAEQVEKMWNMILAAFRARMLSLPIKAAQLVITIDDFHEAERIIRDQVYEALTELAEYDVEKFTVVSTTQPEDDSATAETDGKPVGRRKPKAKPGSKRRTRKVADK